MLAQPPPLAHRNRRAESSCPHRITIRLKAQSHRYYVGVLLLALFVLQDVGSLKWALIEVLQANDTYKAISGVLILLFIAVQWGLALLRRRVQGARSRHLYHLHNNLGLVAPAVYYMHSTRFGYAYLLVLSLAYFTNFAVGLVNREFWDINISKYTHYWTIVHITLSVLIVSMVLYHIGVVLYYE